MHRVLAAVVVLGWFAAAAVAGEPYSGIYPHLAYFNEEGECGSGAVVPWAGRLWVVTYGPHLPHGSSDKLYEITPDLRQIVRPESVGGTPANRMIHKESGQLNIGPYFIDESRRVRTIDPSRMPGRLTGTARHLTDPANKVYVATMEEGLYEVDVHSLAVTELIRDGNKGSGVGEGVRSKLPGYHGKGLYSGQGLLVYANNGEYSKQARTNPFVPSGALASWRGEGDWRLIRRNQFTEVTGPGGIHGAENPGEDPIWAVGWDARSLILMCLSGGEWTTYRLPKASHSYDGAHGWNTEWPRIRDIGEEDLLMTMHGMFWRFPRSFGVADTCGVAPRSSYLKVVGDFCRWQDQLVLGCDDTANREFLNSRQVKGQIAAPQSQSNLWFLAPERLDQLGPVIGRGAVWLNDPAAAGAPSDPFLVNGYQRRAIHFSCDQPTELTLEVDRAGDGQWREFDRVRVDGYAWVELPADLQATWLRVRSSASLAAASAWFHYANRDDRPVRPRRDKFAGVAAIGAAHATGGPIRSVDGGARTLSYAASDASGPIGHYTLGLDPGGRLTLDHDPSPDAFEATADGAAIPSREGVLEFDDASIVYTNERGARYRLPLDPAFREPGPLGRGRVCREVSTERDLFNCGGTFYELPARNAGGFARLRPVCSHRLGVKDYCSYRGLMVVSGVDLTDAGANRHVVRSADGRTGLWVGAIDDLWELGKPVGVGGPWSDADVQPGETSDPYLMTGYDKKTLLLESSAAAGVTVEVDISGLGDWCEYRVLKLAAGQPLTHQFPDAFQAYWVRFRSDAKARLTATLRYE